jgi:hypothetical protein
MFRYNTYVVKFSDDFQIDSFESVADFVKNFQNKIKRFCVVIAWVYGSGSVRMRRVLERHPRHLEDTRPRQGKV